MKISERITGTIENWRKLWADTLKSWLEAILSFGLELFFDVIGKAAAPKLKPLIDSLEATGKIPPELKPILDEIKSPTGQIGAIFSQSASSALIGGAIGKIIDAILLPLAYATNSVTRNVELADAQMIGLWLRGKWNDAELDKKLSWLGVPSDNVANLKELAQVRLDPMSVITAWRRDKAKYEPLFNDLRHQGWTEDRIEAIKFVTQFFPSPQDLINWEAKEVFEPDAIAKYGLADEFELLDLSLFEKAGVSEEQARNYWMAHWQHASFLQVIEMLHRGQLKEEDVWDWFRLVEIPPYWRQKLINVSWNVPTRVDVRRFWDMGTIDEARLREIYAWLGYHGKDLDDYVLWTKVYVAFPDLIARFKNGWITEEEVRGTLITLGMPPSRVETMWQAKFKPEAPARVTEELSLTKAEIVKGVKNGVISWEQGKELLQEIGKSEFEAEYILTINVGASTGSPDTYPEFKLWTQQYRKAMGLSSIEVPNEIIEASKEVARAKEALQQVEAKERIDISEAKAQTELTNAEYRYRQLLIKWEAAKKAKS